ncbi:hypothetical protein FIV03_01295 [Labrenzia sp. THAF187b]|nr:hypothetical protein FIV03_01295 [Labrenzia sp. THAF187b]
MTLAETISFAFGGRSHRLECATALLPSLGVTRMLASKTSNANVRRFKSL